MHSYFIIQYVYKIVRLGHRSVECVGVVPVWRDPRGGELFHEVSPVLVRGQEDVKYRVGRRWVAPEVSLEGWFAF